MTSLSKVTIKKGEEKYQWSQTDEAVVIYLPIKNVLLKNIDIFQSDLLLKVNAQSIKFFSAIDFLNEVDYMHQKNRVQLLDDRIEIFLIKKEYGLKWETLEVQGLSKQEITKRRNETVDRFYKDEAKRNEETKQAIHSMEKEVIDKQMKVEGHERKHIKNSKKEQLKKAQEELFADLDQVKELDAKLSKDKKENDTKLKTQKALEQIHKEIQIDKLKKKNIQAPLNNNEDIFGINDVQDFQGNKNYTAYQSHEKRGQCNVEEIIEEEPIIQEQPTTQIKQEEAPLPEVRQKQDVKIDFTEKKFPHLPARESQMKEAPFPKSKKIEKKTKEDLYENIDDKDPLWLKDKGDHYYKRNDYYSAIAAYSKSIENDKDFLLSRLNRATTFMRMRQFGAAVDELDELESKINNLDKKEKDEDPEYYEKILGRALLKRGAANAWVSQFDEAIKDYIRAKQYKGIFSENKIQTIENDIELVIKRKNSQDLKLQGDIFFARNMLNDSLNSYLKAIESDPMNEYALSNVGVIYLKRQDYENCFKYTQLSLQLIERFQSDTKEFQKDNTLEVKLLQRRAKCFEIQSEFEKAKDDLDRAQILDRDNPIVRASQLKIQLKLSTIRFEEYREKANDYLKSKMFAQALEFYDKCLKITRKATSLDNVAIYVNKTACLLSLERFNQVIQECNDAIRLIKNYKNRNDGKHSQEDQTRMQQMELRIAVRKGNALQKLNKIDDAIQEYERALKIDPQNQQILKDMNALKKL